MGMTLGGYRGGNAWRKTTSEARSRRMLCRYIK